MVAGGSVGLRGSSKHVSEDENDVFPFAYNASHDLFLFFDKISE